MHLLTGFESSEYNLACVKKQPRKVCPSLVWLPKYGEELTANLLVDVSTGILVGVLAVSHGLSYTTNANVPVVRGLYAACTDGCVEMLEVIGVCN